MDKSKIYLNLTMCTKEEQRHLEKLTGFKISHIKRYPYLQMIFSGWNQSDCTHLEGKTQLTYPEFIKLFEGVEGENNGWFKIEEGNDLPRQRGEFWFVSQLEKGKIIKACFNPNPALDGNKAHYVKLYSHYQPIQKPEPPKF